MSLIIHSSDLLGTASIAASRSAKFIDAAREDNLGDIWRDLNEAENLLVAALAELRVAKHGIKRRQPAFRAYESDQLIADESSRIGFDLGA